MDSFSDKSKDSKWEEERKGLLSEFDQLLESIKSAKSKEKLLWRQIYENAISDRHSANMCFVDLFKFVANDASNHTMNGVQLAKYLERMEKSNEQLIKLSGIIQKALENQQEDEVDIDDLYDKMRKEDVKTN